MGRIAGACLGLLIGATLAAQERTFPVPANVTTDGVPPIPMPLVQAVAPYGQFRQAILRAWHPTEREIIITTSFGAVPQLHRVKTPGGARTQMTFFTDGVSTRPGGVPAEWPVVRVPGTLPVVVRPTSSFKYDLARGTTVMLTDGKSSMAAPHLSNWPHRIRLDRARRQEPRPLRHEPVGAWLTARAGQGRRAMVRDRLALTRRRFSRCSSFRLLKRISGPCVRIPARRR